jgi:hypothetical protein
MQKQYQRFRWISLLNVVNFDVLKKKKESAYICVHFSKNAVVIGLRCV